MTVSTVITNKTLKQNLIYVSLIERGRGEPFNAIPKMPMLGDDKRSAVNKNGPKVNTEGRTHSRYNHEQALVCLSNRETLDVSRGRPFHCKIANDRVFLYLYWPDVFSHLAACNYNGLWFPSLRIGR